MKFGDRLLQSWRISQAARWISPGSRVLDIGCADGVLFRLLGGKISEGIGVDPDLARECRDGPLMLLRGTFPQALPNDTAFDAITMLAVLEHVPHAQQAILAEDCARYLKPGGRLIITVPSAAVDHILTLLMKLRLVDGMSVEEHWGFRPEETPRIFSRGGLRLLEHSRFQLGLNNLFVFEKSQALAN